MSKENMKIFIELNDSIKVKIEGLWKVNRRIL